MAHSTARLSKPKSQAKFPLWVRKGGTNGKPRWCRKIRGRFFYFGNVADDPKGDAALRRWAEQADDLLAGRKPRAKDEGNITIGEVCDRFVVSKDAKLEAGEISYRTRKVAKGVCDAMVKHFGSHRPVDDVRPDEFAALRKLLAQRLGPVQLGQEISRVRSVFKYAYDAGLIERPVRFGPDFIPPSRKVLRLHRAAKGERMLEPAELRRIIDAANPRMRAMILLGLNCGFGNHDNGMLPRSALNLDTGWLNYPRPKTGVQRRCPLWRETVDAIKAVLARSKTDSHLVFTTKFGGSFAKLDSSDNPVAKVFRELVSRLGLYRPGLSFYSLRHIFQTIGDGAKDPVATSHVMGHADRSTAGSYRERIDDERLIAVVEHVRRWLYPEAYEQPKPAGKRKAKAKSKARRQSDREPAAAVHARRVVG